MTLVRFASTCDHAGCERRSPEWTEWPSCRSCQLHTCPRHTREGTLKEGDGDGPDTVCCVGCDLEDA